MFRDTSTLQGGARRKYEALSGTGLHLLNTFQLGTFYIILQATLVMKRSFMIIIAGRTENGSILELSSRI